MKLVINIKLRPTAEQATSLRRTLEACNAACTWLSAEGWKTGTLRQYDLHKLAYRGMRERFRLTAQAAVRCIAKVADAYKLDRKTQRFFRKHAAQPYDERILRFCAGDVVSIWTLDGRLKIACALGDRQRVILPFRRGEVDLMLVRGKWYLACVCDVDEPELIKTTDVLGVDLGVVNIATDSTGERFSGKAVEENRRRYAHRRRNLQRKGTRSAKRKLRTLSGRQARFQKNVNHVVSKALVAKARTLPAAIALEDLKGIRSRVKARRRQRATLGNWGFHQLRQFVTYKAAIAGVPIVFVDPRHTSQTCPVCGFVSKTNRKTRQDFACSACGCAGAADHVAALNIRLAGLKARAAVNLANGDGVSAVSHIAPVTSLALEGGAVDLRA